MENCVKYFFATKYRVFVQYSLIDVEKALKTDGGIWQTWNYQQTEISLQAYFLEYPTRALASWYFITQTDKYGLRPRPFVWPY